MRFEIGNIRRRIAEHPNEVKIFCISFLVHLVASIFLFRTFGDRVLSFENEDALGYVALAEHIVGGEGFIYKGLYSAVRTPLYPLFLALLFFLRLPMPWTVLIIQNMLASIAAVLIYRIGSTLFSRRVGSIAGYIYALEPYMIMTSNLATTETFFNVLVLSFALVFARWYMGHTSKKHLFWSASLLGLMVLTRPVVKFLPLIIIPLIGIRYAKTHNMRAFVPHTLVFLSLFLAVLAPWSLRQYVRFGTARLTNIDANMMYFRIAPIIVSMEEGISYVNAIGTLKERLIAKYPEYTDERGYTFDYYDFMTTETKRMVSQNPLPVVQYYALSLIPGLTGTGYEYILEEVFHVKRREVRVSFTELLLKKDFGAYRHAVSRLDVLQAVLIGGALLWVAAYLLIFWAFLRKVKWKEQWPMFAMLILFGGYFIFFSLGPQIHARYRMPSFPFLYLLFAFAANALYESHLHRHPRVQ